MCSSGATCLCWRSVLFMEEIGELEENHRPVASSFKSNYHTMATTACPRNRLSLYINHRVFKTITVRVHVIIHFCDSMWSLWVEANLVVYIYFVYGDPIIKNECILVFNAIFSNISAISLRPVLLVEYPEKTGDPGQATGKIYHLRLRVECTLFVIYKGGCKPMSYWW
jgi:hypothetical protein